MATEITLPELGENVEGGDVVDIKVKEGADVAAGQALLEVEAEKSTVEVPSPSAGKITKVLVKKGENVKTGQALFVIEQGADGEAKARPAEEKKRPQPAHEEQETEDVKEEPAAGDEPEDEAPKVAAPAAKTPVPSDGEAAAKSDKIVPAGPATRRLARELGVDLAAVAGSGPSGRVTQEDVKNYVKERISQPASTAAPAGVKIPPLPDFGKWGAIERQPLDAVRRKTAEQMALAWSLIPHVTHHDQADITDLEAFRKQQDAQSAKITVTAFALKAAAIALKQYPRVNATLDLASQQLILKHYYHIGVAVDTERGLLVPVLRDVDKKSVQELARELAEAAQRARDKKLGGDEMRGGTFTITNLGGIGGTSFTPIINYPEVAILGMSRSRLQPVIGADGKVAARLLLPLSLSYDHRVIDGAEAARFVRTLVEMLENPLVMLLHA